MIDNPYIRKMYANLYMKSTDKYVDEHDPIISKMLNEKEPEAQAKKTR